MSSRISFLLVASIMFLLPCAGLYGFGSDFLREAAAANASPASYLFSSSGSIYGPLMLNFLISGLGLAPLIAWLAINLVKESWLPSPIKLAGQCAAYLLMPFGILPSRIMLRQIRAMSGPR